MPRLDGFTACKEIRKRKDIPIIMLSARSEEYDIIIDRAGAEHTGYGSFVLHRMQLRLKVAADSPLRGKQLTMAQLRTEDFISLGEESNMTQILLRACRAAEPDI